MERKTSDNKIRYKTVGIQEATKSMDEEIEQIASILHIRKTRARILLNYFKWDSYTLLETYFSEEDLEELLREANIGLDPGPDKTIDHLLENLTCGLCTEAVLPKDIQFLSCKHAFCTCCWTSYLEEKIVDTGMTEDITCPQLNCTVNIGQEEVDQLIVDKYLSLKYREKSVCHFISVNPKYKRCSADGCDKILVFDNVNYGTKRVKCSCGHEFCFSCGENWHSPLTCSNFKRWMDKVDERCKLDTERYLLSQTKNCPNCQARIQKDGGGNQMICCNKTCGHKFCWNCLKPGLQCEGSCEQQQHIDKSKSDVLDYFDFNLSGYVINRNGLKSKNMLPETFEKTTIDLPNGTSIPFGNWFLEEARNVLSKCRQTLMCSYALGYFLPEDNEAIIFRINQIDLQDNVIGLANCLEEDLGSSSSLEIPEEFKRALMIKYQYCENRRKVLKEHMRGIQIIS